MIEALCIISHHWLTRLQIHFLTFYAAISEHEQGLQGRLLIYEMYCSCDQLIKLPGQVEHLPELCRNRAMIGDGHEDRFISNSYR